MTTPPTIPPAVEHSYLAGIRAQYHDGPSASTTVKHLLMAFRQIDHLTARLAAAQTYTPRPIEQFSPLGLRIMGRPSINHLEPRYVRHSDHLNAMAQVTTALNLTTHLWQEDKAALAACRQMLGLLVKMTEDGDLTTVEISEAKMLSEAG